MAALLEKPDTQNAVGEQVTEPTLANIRQEWAWVKGGIEEILAEQPQLTFRPEDVYAACLNGDAHLWLAPEGFVVSTESLDEYTGTRTFFLWLAWAKNRGENCAMKYIGFFEKTAKQYGFSRIETRTPIGALETYFLADGWKKDTVIYTREL